VEIQRLTGMRPTEVTIVRTVDLNTTGTIWEYRPARHKLDHLVVERFVMIGLRAQEILKHWIRTDIEAYLFSPVETLEKFHAERRESRKTPVAMERLG
jgi:integrase